MIAIITDPAVGGTFLSWTLYYLSGRNEYYHAKTQSVLQVSDSPLTKVNAHNFRPNQLLNSRDVDQYFSKLKEHNEYVYMHQFRDNTKSAVDLLCGCTEKTIVVSNPSDYVLYNCSYNPRGVYITSRANPSSGTTNADEIYNDFTEYFFKDSKEYWKNENLNDVWDKREFIALNFNPFINDSIVNYITHSTARYHLHSMDLWNTFQSSVREVFEYVGLNIDESRFDHWVNVYQQWQTKHHNRLKFVWYFDTIIDYILKGIEFDLSRFNLDIQQEAAIQRVLIYKHNLNLRTWQLSKFTNTKQLHNLLEPNIHDLSKSGISGLTA